jgi:hypothetical protein
MPWFLSGSIGLVILIFVCPRLYLGYSNLQRSINTKRELGVRIPPTDISTAKLRKVGLFFSLILAVGFGSYGASRFMLTPDEAKATEAPTEIGPSLPVPSDPGAQYTVIYKDSVGNERTIITKRTSTVGTSYSKRLYNCSAGTAMYLGNGGTLAEMKASRADRQMTPVNQGSIAYYVGLEACK